MNDSETHTSTGGNTASELVAAEFATVPSAEDFDATALALSRLSVIAERSTTDGSASPQLDIDSTYEMALPSCCPSPSKRSSEYFDHTMEVSSLKRIRTEITQGPIYSEAPSEVADKKFATSHNTLPIGLGLVEGTVSNNVDESLQAASVNGSIATSLASLPAHDGVSSVSHSTFTGRRRARSAPNRPSAVWSAKVAVLKHKNKQAITLQRNTTNLIPLLKPQSQEAAIGATRPPISQHTLRELELSEIFKNAQLRHDIVHDPNLQFRPNTDGERGAKKRSESDRYWRTIARELNRVQSMSKAELLHSRLSVMFQEMKSILLSLVPSSEKAQVEASFDHVLFMQTLSHDLFSPAAFARYMSSLMKRHCAPMRDDAIDQTVTRIEFATSPAHFAEALKSTFDVLEMMKLDVANHQLRTLRGYLLDTSVEFEKSWFARKYQSGIQSASLAVTWFQKFSGATKDKHNSRDSRAVYVDGLMSLLQDTSTKSDVPSTFIFDQGRLVALRKDIRELVFLNIAVLLYKQLSRGRDSTCITEVMSELWSLLPSDRTRTVDRWIHSIPEIALYLASSSLGLDSNGRSSLPSAQELKFAEAWLTTHMSGPSPIFTMVHSRLSNVIRDLVYNDLVATSVNGHKIEKHVSWGIMDICEGEVQSISRRVTAVAEYHWKVHASTYIQESAQSGV